MLQELIVWRGANAPLQEQRLWQLAIMAETVAKKTGCGEEQAIVFLLCDQIPRVPWVGWRLDSQNGVIELTVRSPRVSPTDVAIAYRSVRDAFYGKKRRGGEWPYLAEAFVNRLKASGEWTTWKAGFLRFKAEHPDQPYTSDRTFWQAVHSRRQRS